LNYVAEASQEESFGAGGILDSLKEGLSRLVNAAPDATTALAGSLLRKKLNTTVTRFAGDAFVYLARRGTKDAPGAIVKTVLDALRNAQAARTADDDKLVVIAHSFGGEIMYDILTHFDPTIQLDGLITVGSQVGLFEEMKLYLASRPNLPPDPPAGHIARPARRLLHAAKLLQAHGGAIVGRLIRLCRCSMTRSSRASRARTYWPSASATIPTCWAVPRSSRTSRSG
jgi:pimeloyl-ACP methyl ester carboxylesterase